MLSKAASTSGALHVNVMPRAQTTFPCTPTCPAALQDLLSVGHSVLCRQVQTRGRAVALGSLTMLTSDTTSMLAISIRMPTPTGGPAGKGEGREGDAGAGLRRGGSPGSGAGARGARAAHLRSRA